jgi:hypothetical protein
MNRYGLHFIIISLILVMTGNIFQDNYILSMLIPDNSPHSIALLHHKKRLGLCQVPRGRRLKPTSPLLQARKALILSSKGTNGISEAIPVSNIPLINYEQPIGWPVKARIAASLNSESGSQRNVAMFFLVGRAFALAIQQINFFLHRRHRIPPSLEG